MPQRSKPQLLNTMVGTQLLLSDYMAQANFPTLDSMTENSILDAQRQRQNRLSYMARSQFPTALPTVNSKLTSFSKFPILSPSLPGMTSFTLQPYFQSGVYYDNCDCHILCARAQNCTQSLCT